MLCLFESGLWCESAGEKSVTHELTLKVDSYASLANPRQAGVFFNLFKFQSRNALVSSLAQRSPTKNVVPWLSLAFSKKSGCPGFFGVLAFFLSLARVRKRLCQLSLAGWAELQRQLGLPKVVAPGKCGMTKDQSTVFQKGKEEEVEPFRARQFRFRAVKDDVFFDNAAC